MLKASRNKYDLSDRRNEWYESMVQIYGGTEFQIARTTHTENALLPNFVLVRWMTAALVDEDLSLDRRLNLS